MDDFSGKVALVTGAASGIGRAIADGFVNAGATVIGADINRSEFEALRDSGIEPTHLDVTSEEDVEGVFKSVATDHGKIDVLVNCAGVVSKKVPVTQLEAEEWNRVIKVDLFGVFLCSQAGARVMAPLGSGRIINVASITAKIPRVNMAAYCVAKAGVLQFSRVLALELAKTGVTVNALCPGGTVTPLLEESTAGDGRGDLDYRVRGDTSIYRMGVPTGRLAYPGDHVGPTLFLASEAAAHITGQAIFVDGGESIV
jgi:2,3-dihydro-2,3-dihydroxybenzoate dehydrogenase